MNYQIGLHCGCIQVVPASCRLLARQSVGHGLGYRPGHRRDRFCCGQVAQAERYHLLAKITTHLHMNVDPAEERARDPLLVRVTTGLGQVHSCTGFS
jgi:hypothetical protein